MPATLTRSETRPALAAALPDDLLDASWYTTDEIGRLLQVKPETVREWIKRGLPALRLSAGRGGYRVRREDVNAWLLDRYGSASQQARHRSTLAAVDAAQEPGARP